MHSKDEVYKKVEELVIKFRNNREQYTNKNYNETETRRDFLDPFFEAFGWDVSNKAGKSQTYRDVIHEDKVKVGKETKAPDYAFRIGGSRVFFAEAKKPGVNIKDDSIPAFQLRRYGWSAKLGISFLTDFEELAVYDCTKKPNVNDKASAARIEYIHFEDYLKKFDFLYEILNKERIEQGSLEKYIAGTSNKKGTESVDIDFLSTLDNLRTKLASNISKLNKDLSVRDLNYSVQQIIDRIIFLRAAEDRGIEEYGDLKKTCENKNDNFYSNLLKIFEHADGRYNSGLFDFSKDSISSSIVIDNKVIKEIINELYYPLSPYEFSVISVEIMGNAYEQFLGKTITIGKNHSAKIELKPEVRKAGGVYYTPEYIVDYIVKNTVGEAIKGKKPEEIANIKILDPACGSGSFLLGAYKYLLNYHIEYYNKIKDRAKFKGVKEDVIKENGDLTIWIKKQILRNNIFGVDIDSNAAEVTKLSLLMKCLEGESPASIQNNQDLFNERALPSLEDNIKCGNSLIGNDFYESHLDLDDATLYKINCFDWNSKFRDIMKTGGFDVVIGNPPWGASFDESSKGYIKNNYNHSDIEIESYILFIEKGIKNLSSNGYLGLIMPSNLFTNIRYFSIRKFILENCKINTLIDLGSGIFKSVAADSGIIISNKNIDSNNIINAFVGNIQGLENIKYNLYKQSDFVNNNNYIFNIYIRDIDKKIAEKIKDGKVELKNFVSFARGIEFGYSSKYVMNNKENDLYKPIVAVRCIQRYFIHFENKFIEFNEKDKSNFKSKDIYEKEKILLRRIGNKLIASIDFDKYYNLCDIYNLLLKDDTNINLKYLLSIINSKLMSYYLDIEFKSAKKIFPKIPIANLEKLPIKNLNLDDKQDKEIYDKLVNLVDSIIDLNKKLSSEKNPNTVEMLNARIQAVDKAIDKIVYSLYGLNDEEIRVIEGE